VWRHIEVRADDEPAGLFNMARVSAEKAEEQAKSDDEKSLLEQDTARYGGAWFRIKGTNLTTLQERVGHALEALGFERITVEDPGKLAALAKKSDSKTEALVAWVRKNLFVGGKLRDDERLIVFTEYKETLFHLEQRFRQEGLDDESMSLLYGGMTVDQFEQVKSDFEDPANPVRLMLATDAASEGINMQESCRWIIHFDIPWSPSKLQQRNGRVSATARSARSASITSAATRRRTWTSSSGSPRRSSRSGKTSAASSGSSTRRSTATSRGSGPRTSN